MTNSGVDEDVSYFVHGEGTNRVERKKKRQQINVERLTVQLTVQTELWLKRKKRIKNLSYYMHGKLTLQDFPARYKLK